MRNHGFTLIELMIVVAIIAIIAAIAIPNMLRARMGANEASAIATLKQIVIAETQFKASGAEISAGGISQYGDLTQLANAIPGFIDRVIGASNTAVKSGYSLNFQLGSDTTFPTFEVTNEPINNRNGSRNFFVDPSGSITWVPLSSGSSAISSSPAVQ